MSLVAVDSFAVMPSAFELAERISRTEFVPTSLRGKPEAIMAAILTGHEVGIGPMQALSKIHVIEGRPAMAAELMRALALAAGHDIWVEESTTSRVTVCGIRSGSDKVSRVTWTMDDAKRAGLDGRQNWRKFPRAMLLARATSELCRIAFPDVLGGISYTVEELTDGDVIDGEPVEEAPVKPATTTRKAPAKKAAPAKAAAPKAAAPAAPSRPPAPPLPGEGDDDIVDAEIVEDDEPTPAPAGDVSLEQLVEEAGQGKVLATARRLAKEAGAEQPTALDQVPPSLATQVAAALGITASAAAEPAEENPDADRDRLRKRVMALLVDIFPTESLPPRKASITRDRMRYALTVGVVTSDPERRSSDSLTVPELQALVDLLVDVKDGRLGLERSDDGVTLNDPDGDVFCPWVDAAEAA